MTRPIGVALRCAKTMVARLELLRRFLKDGAVYFHPKVSKCLEGLPADVIVFLPAPHRDVLIRQEPLEDLDVLLVFELFQANDAPYTIIRTLGFAPLFALRFECCINREREID